MYVFQHDYMRMEKADILENVVKFLRCQTLGGTEHNTTDRSSDYRLGFLHCMREVQQVLEHVCGQANPLTLSINQYLHNRLNETCGTIGHIERLPQQNEDCIKQELISPVGLNQTSEPYITTNTTTTNPSATCSRVPIHPLHSLELHVGHMTCYGGGNPELSGEESFSEICGEGSKQVGDNRRKKMSETLSGEACGTQVVPSGTGEEVCVSSDSVRDDESNNNNNNQLQHVAQNELDSNMWRPW